MKKVGLVFLAVLIATAWISTAFSAGDRKLTIVEPKNRAKVTSPFKVCMKIQGLILEPSIKGVREGKGHHHLLFTSLPKNLNRPLSRKGSIHMIEGLPCQTLKMVPGKHVIRALFAYGDHVPYNPLITDKILVTVK